MVRVPGLLAEIRYILGASHRGDEYAVQTVEHDYLRRRTDRKATVFPASARPAAMPQGARIVSALRGWAREAGGRKLADRLPPERGGTIF